MRTAAILWAIISIFVIGAVSAAPVPPSYRNVRLFMDPDGAGGKSSSKNPYDPCARYNKGLRYTVSGNIEVQFGSGFSFVLSQVVAQAAQIWNNKLLSNGCSFTIAPAGPLPSNFVINDNFSNSASGTVAMAIPQGYGAVTGAQPGIYVNKGAPLKFSQSAYKTIRGMFDSSMSDQDVAHALALVTVVHEFGHALGMAHPIEESDSPKDDVGPRYSPFSMQWTPQAAFRTGPLMIGDANKMLDVMWKTSGKRPLTLADMQPSDVEADTIKQMLSCSAVQLTKDAQRDATCSSFLAQAHRVLQYPDLARAGYELILLQ